jgi:hypothetical protein
LDWLRRYLRLVHGMPSHDIFGRLFGLVDCSQFEAAFRRWVNGVIPALGADVAAKVRSIRNLGVQVSPSRPGAFILVRED